MAYFLEHGFALALIRNVRRVKRRWFNRLLAIKLDKSSKGISVDPTAQIIGLSHISIGRNFHAGPYLRLEAISKYRQQTFNPRIIIGDDVIFNDFVHIGATCHVEIGNNVLMASKIYISDHNHGFYAGEEQSDPESPPIRRLLDGNRKVIIEENVWLGESVSVLPGVTIGRGSIIGANSVVSRSIPPHSIAVGSPAQVVKRFDAESKRWLPVTK